MQRFLTHVLLMAVFVLGLSGTLLAQSAPKPEKTIQKATSKKYYAFAKAVVDNGTLIISNVQEVELEQLTSEELQKNYLLSFKLKNHTSFMKIISTRFGKLLTKTRFPAGFNAVELFETMEEAVEAREFAMKNKEKNLLQVPDFKFQSKVGFEKLNNDIIIE